MRTKARILGAVALTSACTSAEITDAGNGTGTASLGFLDGQRCLERENAVAKSGAHLGSE